MKWLIVPIIFLASCVPPDDETPEYTDPVVGQSTFVSEMCEMVEYCDPAFIEVFMLGDCNSTLTDLYTGSYFDGNSAYECLEYIRQDECNNSASVLLGLDTYQSCAEIVTY